MDADIERMRVTPEELAGAIHGVNRTCGTFAHEKDAENWIADFLRSTGLFRQVYQQVRGYPIFRHHLQGAQEYVSADVLAIPGDQRITTGSTSPRYRRFGSPISIVCRAGCDAGETACGCCIVPSSRVRSTSLPL